MHFETPIYLTVEKLGDVVLAAGAQMPRGIKPLLGGRLFDETVVMAQLIRNGAIARDAAKVPYYNMILDEIEATTFMLRRAYAAKYISDGHYGASIPLIESISKQATGLRNKFAPAP